jgi:hypothetical protein
LAVYSLKYSGTDKPKKKATPVMNRFLIEFMFVNCKNDSPTEAENKNTLILMYRLHFREREEEEEEPFNAIRK